MCSSKVVCLEIRFAGLGPLDLVQSVSASHEECDLSVRTSEGVRNDKMSGWPIFLSPIMC